VSAALDIHPASLAEQDLAYRQVHEMWGRGLPLDEFLAKRWQSVAHNRAEWWVGTRDGQVLCSLGRHPLTFHWRGRDVPGFGICAVYTHPSARKQGLAAALCQRVADVRTSDGDELGLLYSDIPPAYYEALGYRVVSPTLFRCDDLAGLAASGEQTALRSLDPQTSLTQLARWYAAAHERDALFLARSAEYWHYSLARWPNDEFLEALSPAGHPLGYLRASRQKDSWEILETCVHEPASELAAWRALAAAAHATGAQSLRGWLRPRSVPADHFREVPRTREIPMIKSLRSPDDDLSPANCHFWATDHF